VKWAAGILLLAAWITPSYAAAPEDLAAYQALAQQDLRLATIGYRLAQANAPFCDRKTFSPGWVLHDEAQYPDKGLATTAFVFRSPVAISSVVSGGAAAQLGLQPGDGIAAVDGIDVTGPIAVKTRRVTARVANIQTLLADAFVKSGSAVVSMKTAAGPKDVTLQPPAVCASQFWVDTNTKLDAGADGVSVRVTQGLMTFAAADDAELAAVVAHEMAHNVLRHRDRLVAAGGAKKQILATEMEADRLSVWLMQNAGYDPAAAVRFIERFGRKTSLGIFSAATHLRWRNRQTLMQAEIADMMQVDARNGLRSPPLLSSSN
jgi:Zn-dependent protease with chaperone function